MVEITHANSVAPTDTENGWRAIEVGTIKLGIAIQKNTQTEHGRGVQLVVV